MRNRQLVHHGLTLVELLVVVAIIGLLLAVSVPLLKPMLVSQRTANAARVLAGSFQEARMKSIQEGQSYGIKLVPFRTAPTTSVQLRLQKSTPIWVNPQHIRVTVEDGEIVPRHFWQNKDTAEIEWRKHGDPRNTHEENAKLASVKELLVPGRTIQFNRIGRLFTIGVDYKLAFPDDNLDLPDNLTAHDALEYCISGVPTPAWVPQTVMPQGTIVDLVFSGGETVDFDGDDNKESSVIPRTFSPGDDVIVMFSPAGHVDRLYVNGESKKVNEMLYFCVGEWDRQIDRNTEKTFAEDGKSNLEVPATYWITIHQKTGEVRIAENAPVLSGSNTIEEKLCDARKFAKEHFFNVGGF